MGNMRVIENARRTLARFEWDLLGFGLCRAWISIVFALPVPALLSMGYGFSPWYFLPGALACAALGIVSGRALPERVRTAALLASAALTIFGVAGITSGIGTESELPVVLSLACTGIGAALLQALWGDKMAVLPSRDINLYTVASMLFAALVSILAWSATSLEAALLVFAALPAGSFILLFRGFDSGRWSILSKTDATEEREDRPLHLGRLCISIFVFVFVFNFAYTTLPASPFEDMASRPIRSVANVSVTIALLIMLLAKGNINQMSLYRLSFPVLLGALLLMLVIPSEHAAVASVLAAAGYKLFDVLFWCVLVGLAHENRAISWRVLGFGMAANFLGMGLGVGLRERAWAATASGALDPTLLVCGLMFSLVVIIMLILPESVVSQIMSRSSKKQRQEEPSLAQCCSTASEMHGLTAREREVLVFLAQGRTQGVIARKLGISEGTAHTHIIHVYQKLEVHSQQELIDLVEGIAE